MSKKIAIVDSTLRDGMYAVEHQFSPQDMRAIAQSLDESGVDIIEVGFGEGMGGSSLHFGIAAATDEDYLIASASVVKRARIAVALIPGIGTKQNLEMAARNGASVVRISTHVTESDIGEQHIALAKALGLTVIGAMMCCHMVPPEVVGRQASLIEGYGADYVYIQDSAGAMLPRDIIECVEAVRQQCRVPVGLHCHNNLGLAVANSLAGVEAGASMLDCSVQGMGGGAGNTMTEAMIAVLSKAGYTTGVSLSGILDTAQSVVKPRMRHPQVMDRYTIWLGYAGVVGSMLNPILAAAERFGVEPDRIIAELGKREVVAGQDDVIIEVASLFAH